jgi:hypothetical protein
MKTKYKFIYFEKANWKTEGFKVWRCLNSKSSNTLGYVEYYLLWKQYIFEAYADSIVFSASCLDDISHFLKQLNEAGGGR